MSSWPQDVTTRADFATALTWLREQAGLTVREVARRLGTPPGTLGDYFSGRHIPSTTQLPLLRRLLAECGVTQAEAVDAWLAAWHRARSASDRRIARRVVPYRGLAPFQPEDADLFFGRTAEVDAILDRIAALQRDPGPSHGLLAVIGPSGSGKSSLLRAGVVAALRTRTDGCALMTPGPDPLDNFRAAVRNRPRVLVIDQFEEVFTGGGDCAGFLDALATRDPAITVVIGMRADFYSPAAQEPVLLAALQHAQFVVGPIGLEQVRAAILGPAERVGATVEPGLVDVVLADVAPRGQPHEAGALPLLSHALLCTWERARGNRLTIADYHATGGIRAAVQRSAEEAFGSLNPGQQEAARRMFLRLVSIDVRAVSRRHVPWGELERLDGAGTAEVGEVVNQFLERRLLTADAETISISHDTLLSAWSRLHDWIDADRAGLRLHRQLTDAANGWQEAGRDASLLLHGVRLDAAVEWAADPDHQHAMNRLEREFVAASTAQARAERSRERRRAHRLVQLVTVVALLAVTAGLLAGYAFHARSEANRERAKASAARDDALSRQVAFQARAIHNADPALAQQLALVAYRIAPTDAARSEVLDESARPVITRVLGAQGPTPLALSPDGRLVAVGHADDGSVHLYALRARRPPAPLGVVRGAGIGHGSVFTLAFSPDGRQLAAGGVGGHVHLWSLADPAHPRSLAVLQPAFAGAVESIAFSPDGRTVAAGSAGPHPLQRWSIADPGAPRLLAAPRGVPAGLTVQAVTFSPDGRTLAAGGTDGVVRSWPAATAASSVPRTGSTNRATIDALAFTPGGRMLLAGDRAGVVTVWSLRAERMVAVRSLRGGTNSQVNTLAISPDGSQLAVGSSDNSVRRWNTSTWAVLVTTQNPGPVTGVAFSADNQTLLSTAADGTLRLWSANARLIPVGTGSVFGLGLAGSRLAVATNGAAGGVQLWDVRDPNRPARLGPVLRMPSTTVAVDGTTALRPDGRLVAAGNAAGQVQLWDVHDPAHPRPIGMPFTAAGGLIESLAFGPGGRWLAVGSDDHTVRVWDLASPARPRPTATLRTGSLVFNAAFNGNAHLLAAASADMHAYLWDVRDPAHPRQVARLGGFASYVYAVAFSPDGRTLAVTSADHTTRLWDLTRPGHPAPLGRPLTGPSDYILGAAFNPAGTLLAVASNDHTVWVYDVHDRRHPVATETLRAVAGNVDAAAFSADGRTLIAGGRYASLALWTVDPASYAAHLCSLAGAPITRAEWRQYVPGAPYRPPCR